MTDMSPVGEISRTTHRRSFEAMGTTAEVIVVGGSPTLLDDAQQHILDLHRRWTRFDAASEIARMNATGGSLTLLEPDTFSVITDAVDAWHSTEGAFDPTIATSMVGLGYDRDLASIDVEQSVSPRPAPGCGDIELVPEVHGVVLPEGVQIDLGGIGKGAAADATVELLTSAGADGACVSIGGDLRVSGRAPQRGPWTIELEATRVEGSPGLVVELDDGAVATSRSDYRVWARQGERQHHLLNPSSGLPTDPRMVAVSVIADRATRAEPITKAAFVAGPAMAREVLAAFDAPGVIVTDDGSVHAAGSIRRYLR